MKCKIEDMENGDTFLDPGGEETVFQSKGFLVSKNSDMQEVIGIAKTRWGCLTVYPLDYEVEMVF
jgi:hypothetical protein